MYQVVVEKLELLKSAVLAEVQECKLGFSSWDLVLCSRFSQFVQNAKVRVNASTPKTDVKSVLVAK